MVGRYEKGAWGYRAFVPGALPPQLDIARLAALTSEADQALGRLDGAATILPNPDLFVAMYVRREALLSSQIEGTQASLAEVLEFEDTEDETEANDDVAEVVNYVAAMNLGLKRLKELPLSARLIREIHERLMRGVRGENRAPGEFRRTQNWIGPPGSTQDNASFVPPPPQIMAEAIGQLELFLHDTSLPALIHAAICHAQFETIHPFLDGNGRVGRLLITFLLCHRGVMQQPLLYLSHYLKRHRTEYYDRLQATRDKGRWDDWLEFILRGVRDVATEATSTSRSIIALRQRHQQILQNAGGASGNLLRLHELLFRHPVCSAGRVERSLDVSAATANSLIRKMIDAKILMQSTSGRRNRKFMYTEFVDLFEDTNTDTDAEPEADADSTGSA